MALRSTHDNDAARKHGRVHRKVNAFVLAVVKSVMAVSFVRRGTMRGAERTFIASSTVTFL